MGTYNLPTNVQVNDTGHATLHNNANSAVNDLDTRVSSLAGGAKVITAASVNALAVGANGVTNPALNVDTSTSSAATGLNLQTLAAGNGIKLSATSSGTNENLYIDGKGTGDVRIGTINTGGNLKTSLIVGITAANANAFIVGPNGGTNPTFQISTNTASAATGISLRSNAAGAGVAIVAISSASAENLTLDAKGAGGAITINGGATGDITLGQATANSVNFARTAIAVGAGASATLSTIGGSGPTTAAQNSWLQVKVGGTTSWIPIWR